MSLRTEASSDSNVGENIHRIGRDGIKVIACEGGEGEGVFTRRIAERMGLGIARKGQSVFAPNIRSSSPFIRLFCSVGLDESRSRFSDIAE